MKKAIITLGVLTLGFSANTLAEGNYLPSYVEEGLVKICKTAAQDKLMSMNKSIKALRIKHKTIALNVVCNGKV